jgi:hypothetical protein
MQRPQSGSHHEKKTISKTHHKEKLKTKTHQQGPEVYKIILQ